MTIAIVVVGVGGARLKAASDMVEEGYETSVITKLFITHSDTYTVVALGNMELDGGEQQEEE